MAGKTYNYFFSFAHRDGFGNGHLARNKPITTFDAISEIEKDLLRRNKSVEEVTVLNYQLLSVEDTE